MKKSTLAIGFALVGLLACVALVIWIGVIYLLVGKTLSAPTSLTNLSSVTKSSPAATLSPLIGKWLCTNCAGRSGVTILREYLVDGTWTGHITDGNGKTYDFHGTYILLGNNQYSEVDLTDPQNPALQPGIYNYSISGNILTLSLAEGETLTAVFQRVN